MYSKLIRYVKCCFAFNTGSYDVTIFRIKLKFNLNNDFNNSLIRFNGKKSKILLIHSLIYEYQF